MNIELLASSLLNRRRDLERLKGSVTKALSSFPEGHLTVSSRRGSRDGQPYFTYFTTDGHGHRTYINRASSQLAVKLAQKEYYIQLLEKVEKEIRLIDRYLKNISRDCPENLYPSLVQARKVLVTPFIYPDDEYIRMWKEKPYTGKAFLENDPEHYTESGLRVRSKSEELIANALDRLNIPYKYECPLKLSGGGIYYPDFTVLHVKRRKEMIWEHFGMMDHEEYAQAAVRKIYRYTEEHYYQGDNLVFTFEASDVPITTREITQICRHYFME